MNRKRLSRSAAISWPSNPNTNWRFVCWVWPSQTSSVETCRIAMRKRKNFSEDSPRVTNASTTPVCCMNGGRKHKCTQGARRTLSPRFSLRRCVASPKPKRFVPQETMTLFFAGIDAPGCCKAILVSSKKKSRKPSMLSTAHQFEVTLSDSAFCNQHHAEPRFALHHASVGISSLFERKCLDHRADVLQNAE